MLDFASCYNNRIEREKDRDINIRIIRFEGRFLVIFTVNDCSWFADDKVRSYSWVVLSFTDDYSYRGAFGNKIVDH